MNNSSMVSRCGRADLEEVRIIQTVVYILLIPPTIALNTFVIYLIAKFKSLHNRAMYLALQIVVIDLIHGTVNSSLIWITAVANQWLFGNAGCQILAFIVYSLRSARWILMLVFTIDRLLTVFLPFHYHKHASKIALAMSTTGWTIALLKGLIPVQGILGCYTFTVGLAKCDIFCTTVRKCEIYIAFSSAFDIATGLVCVLLYTILFCKAKQLKKKTEILQTKKKIEISASDKHAAVTFLILFICLLGSALPIYLLSIIVRYILDAAEVRPPAWIAYLFTACRILVQMLVIIDPITILRNRDMRAAMHTLRKKVKQKFDSLVPEPSKSTANHSVSTST